MSFPFRDRSRLSDRLRGKTADELLNELKSEIDKDKRMFFETPFPRTGFPFDDMSRGRQDIRSHLEDLAQRHPEFADQLRCPPWGGEVGSSQGTWSRAREGPSGEDGSSFGQPSDQEQVDEPGPLRGRQRQNNLPQHGLRNTVDLGQHQHEVEHEKCNRGQRSMSAPPDSRTSDQPQRFVSRIDINPLNPASNSSGDGKPPMAPKQQPSPQKPANKPAQPGASNVRHIPIFVEGRDEPVIAKNLDSTPEKIFTDRAVPSQPAFTSERNPPPQAPFVERVIPTQTAGRPQSPFTERTIPTQTAPPQPSFGFSRPSHFTSQHQFQPQQPSTAPQGRSFAKQQEQPPEQQQPAQQSPKVPRKAPEPNDPLSRVQVVAKDVEDLAKLVQAYSGNSRKDKDYIYLDEMLTRNLLKLDIIETEGKDNVRQARKAVIQNIQKCIGMLESKAPLPEEVMDVVEEALAVESQSTDVDAVTEQTSSSNAEDEAVSVPEEGEAAAPPQESEVSATPPSGNEVTETDPQSTEDLKTPGVEMAEASPVRQEDPPVEEESKPAELVSESGEVVGENTPAELDMEVDSGVAQVGQNGEVSGGSPNKAKRGAKKVAVKSKKSQPSS